MALGVLYCEPAPSFDSLVTAQMDQARAGRPKADLNALLRRGSTWTVDG